MVQCSPCDCEDVGLIPRQVLLGTIQENGIHCRPTQHARLDLGALNGPNGPDHGTCAAHCFLRGWEAKFLNPLSCYDLWDFAFDF